MLSRLRCCSQESKQVPLLGNDELHSKKDLYKENVPSDENFGLTSVFIAQTILTSQQHAYVLSKKPIYIARQISKLAFALVIAAFNAILFFKQSKELAKEYFGLDVFWQGIFSFSDSYANFFLSVFASLSLMKILSHFILLKKTNSKHRPAWHIHMCLLVLSIVTSLPMIAPLSSKSDQAMTLISNTLLSLYALYEFHIFYRGAIKASRTIHHTQQHIRRQPEFNKEKLTSQSILSMLKQHYQFNSDLSSSGKWLNVCARVSALFCVLTVVIPYVLAMIHALDDTSGKNGFLNYFISSNDVLRKIVAISVGIISNAPFAVLCAYFGFGIVYECRDLFINKHNIARQYYPKVWISTKILQILITSLSWSTPVKLYLDFFGGPEFTQRSLTERGLVYASAAIIGIGVFIFNLYSNLKLSDTAIEFYALLFGPKHAKFKVKSIYSLDALDLHLNLVKKYDPNIYHSFWSKFEQTSSSSKLATDEDSSQSIDVFEADANHLGAGVGHTSLE